MKILFLDVDGVLNAIEDWIEMKLYPEETLNRTCEVISRAKMAMLQNVVAETDCKIVLSSTWRRLYTLDEFHEVLAMRGWTLPRETFIDVTCSVASGYRGHEVQIWLDENKEKLGVTNICIVDDDGDFQTELRPYFVQTNGRIGMTFMDMERMIAVLNGVPYVDDSDNYTRSCDWNDPDYLLLKELAYDSGMPINDETQYNDVMARIRKVHDKIIAYYAERKDEQSQNA